jgi:hypothetical protein
MVSPEPLTPAESPRRTLPWASTLVAVVLAGVAWGGWHLLARNPERAEALLGSGLHPELLRRIGGVAGLLPGPVAVMELLVVAGVLWLLSLPVRAVLEMRGGREGSGRAASRAGGRAAARAGLRLVRGVAVVVATFSVAWGWLYARPGLEARLDLPASGAVATPELLALAELLVERTNDLYLEVHGTPDAGVPTSPPPGTPPDNRGWGRAVDEGWGAVVERWGLPEAMARPRSAPRTLALTRLLRPLGILGVHAPWTGEALVFADLPGASAWFTGLHESAHQRGVARESDANALAYLVALEMEAPEPRYAAALFLQRQALQALARQDPEAVLRLVEARHPGVQRDVEAMVARARSIQGPVRDAARQANDAMLRRHGIAEGVASYGGSLWIVLALARRDGAEALLP